MSIGVFTDKEIKVLSENPYVKSVSSKGITYTDEFKQIFIVENEKVNFRGRYLRNVDLRLVTY